MKKNSIRVFLFIIKYKYRLFLFLIFTLLLFLRFYEIEARNPFGWDQVDNAWAAQRIIDDHNFPLSGTQAKLNSGIYIGPLYYYFISIFYFFTNLDPIASGIAAGVTSVFTFFALFYVTKKLFSWNVALIAIFLNTISFAGIMWDRIQWPVDFILSVSLIIFYSLYKIITGNPKYAIPLSLALGFSFHVHLTAIFFPVIILLTLPLFPRTKETMKYSFICSFIFLIFLIPSTIAFIQNLQLSVNAVSYGQTYYHGFHLRRVIQLFNDAIIQFEPFFTFPVLKFIKFLIIPLFLLFYNYQLFSKERMKLSYLVILWFIVPWFVLATYSGEISDYYFSANRFIALIIISYLIARIFELKSQLLRIALLIFFIYYSFFNLHKFITLQNTEKYRQKQKVLKAIQKGEKIEFQEGNPESYLYYYLMKKKGEKVY